MSLPFVLPQKNQIGHRKPILNALINFIFFYFKHEKSIQSQIVNRKRKTIAILDIYN